MRAPLALLWLAIGCSRALPGDGPPDQSMAAPDLAVACRSGSCAPNGTACRADCDCCSLLCLNGACGPPGGCHGGDQCCADGETCSQWNECCTAVCAPDANGVKRCGGDPSCGLECRLAGTTCERDCQCCSFACLRDDGGFESHCIMP